MSTGLRKQKVGEIRPSQVLTTFGVGSIIDLPYLSVLLMGLDDWPTGLGLEVGEERLLASVQEVLGTQVKRLLTPPRPPESGTAGVSPFEEGASLGIPVASFPRWMVCPSCRLLAPLSSDLFEPKPNPFRPDQMKYVHRLCPSPGKPPTVLPARFLVACPNGHLDDFPWSWFVHRGREDCRALLRLYEVGTSGEAADVLVKCDTCGAKRSMAEAFGRENGANLPPCRGRRPHLRDLDPQGCPVEHMTAILQGASNSWFSVMLSALSVPGTTDTLGQMVEEYWANLKDVESLQNIQLLRKFGNLRDFAAVPDESLWAAIERKRAEGGFTPSEPSDLKSPEYDIFCNPTPERNTADFRLREVQPPERFADWIEKIVLVERLREVRALIGFTRIGSPGDYDTPMDIPPDLRAPLSRKPPQWVPASEVRGEGIFLKFSEAALVSWSRRRMVAAYDVEFFEAHKKWRQSRNLEPEVGYDHLGLRFVLLHSFAHALIRQLSVECGYTAASLRERIYSRPPGVEHPPMAGVLIYTAASDSEGTLGGLVSLGEPDTLGRHLEHALETARLCSSDPLCAEHRPQQGRTLHGAACHACLFVPETSCERGNKYLDRSVLVETLERGDLAFFGA